MGIAALILGIISLALPLVLPSIGWLGIICGIVAIILGAIARKKSEKKGAATAGLVLGIIAVAVSAAVWIACMVCAHKVGAALEGADWQGALESLESLGN